MANLPETDHETVLRLRREIVGKATGYRIAPYTFWTLCVLLTILLASSIQIFLFDRDLQRQINDSQASSKGAIITFNQFFAAEKFICEYLVARDKTVAPTNIVPIKGDPCNIQPLQVKP